MVLFLYNNKLKDFFRLFAYLMVFVSVLVQIHRYTLRYALGILAEHLVLYYLCKYIPTIDGTNSDENVCIDIQTIGLTISISVFVCKNSHKSKKALASRVNQYSSSPSEI